MSEFGKRFAAGAVGFGAGASLVALAEGTGFNFGHLLPKVPNVALGHAQPPAAKAAIDPDSYTVLEKFDMTCTETISVGVNVTAHAHQALGSGNVSKRIFGDLEVCGDNNKFEADALVTHSAATGAVTSVVGVFKGIQTRFARVD